jgi:exodeoxyribonuclease III
MKIVTWNVNSIKVRVPHVCDYLRATSPDVLLLQETKVADDKFPALEIEDLGYSIAIHGQRTYNGVAILSKHPMEDVIRGLPGNTDDDQSRYIEVTIEGLRIGSLYLPNGNPLDTEKFDYKLRWMGHLRDHARTLLKDDVDFVLGGDWNIAPEAEDLYDPGAFLDDAIAHADSRALWREINYLGLTESFRALHPELAQAWSYFDYQRGAWEKNHGIRIDHVLLSPRVADRLEASGIDRDERGRTQPSDHVPVWCVLAE